MPDIPANLAHVRERVARAAERAGRRPADVLLIGVSKTVDVARIRAAVAAGITALGENRVQEAKAKIAELGRPASWHLIGHLQTNKAKFVPTRFALVHSLDAPRLAEALSGAAARAGVVVPVLVQVNVAEEPQKAGCAPSEAGALIERCVALPGLAVRGLMTMAPFTDDVAVQRRTFAGLRRLRDGLASAAWPLADLSMGMSADYAAAVAEGATMLRLGTVLFGERSA
jgi:hypothetical protein